MSHESFDCHASARDAEEVLHALTTTEFSTYLVSEIYPGADRARIERSAERFGECVAAHQRAFGPGPVHVLRAPGRLNLFAEYLDMCGGDHMSVTLDMDIPACVSVPDRDDGHVTVANTADRFPGGTFSIAEEFARFSAGCPDRTAAAWKEHTRLYPFRGRKQGDSLNYLLSSFLRLQWEFPDVPLRGVDITIGPATLPVRGGVSSSSAMVVLGFLSLWLANRDRLPPLPIRHICRLLGESEWYVGTRGGANDQTTILRGAPGGVLYNLHHLDPLDSRTLPWVKGVGVILCHSLWEADKAMEGNRAFNLRRAWIELTQLVIEKVIAEMVEIRRRPGAGRIAGRIEDRFGWRPGGISQVLDARPELIGTIAGNFDRLGSLSTTLLGVSWDAIDELVDLLPEALSLEEAAGALGLSPESLHERFGPLGILDPPSAAGAASGPENEPLFKIRQTARFFARENFLSAELERTFLEADRSLASGKLQPDSEEYRDYGLTVARCVNDLQHALREDWEVSTPHLDRLISIALEGPGAMAAKLTGAGGGGCVCILVEEDSIEEMLGWLDERFYSEKRNFEEYEAFLARYLRAEDAAVRARAEDMLARLRRAIRDPAPHRFSVHFSRGAGPLEI